MSKTSYASFDEEKYHSAFSTVLREELLKTPEDVKELAEFLGVSPQAINQYKLGQSLPKTENLIKIAQHYHCSLDYLIGLSDVHSPSAEIQAVCDYTGLSEAAVWILHKNVKDIEHLLECGTHPALTSEIVTRCLSQIIEDDFSIFEDLGKYLYYSYSGFAPKGYQSEEELPKAIMLKTPLEGMNAEYTYLNIQDVQDLMLMKIEKNLRRIRESNLESNRGIPGTVLFEQTEDGKEEAKFIPYYQTAVEDID